MRLKGKRFFTKNGVVASLAVLMLSTLLAGCPDGDNTTIDGGTNTNNPPDTHADLTATISGRVIDSSSGAGQVATLSAAGVTTTSAADGTFTLSNVPRSENNTPLIITLTSLPGGYPNSAAAVVAVATGGAVVVEPNVVLAGVEIELHQQGGTIAGQVLDVTGNPVQGVNITLDAVQIPVRTPGTANPNPTGGVHPFELTAANSRGTTDNNGRFLITGVPEDWIYNIIIIPPVGSSNLTFTNQFLPSGSRLNFPDAVGAPPDSGVATALDLAGIFGAGNAEDLKELLEPRLNGINCFDGDGVCAPGEVAQLGASLVAAGAVVLNPALLPGDGPDIIPPFVVTNSEVVDGTIITAAQNTPGRTLSFTISERLLQNDGELAAFLRLMLVSADPDAQPSGDANLGGTRIPFQVTIDAAGTTVTIAPRVFNDAGDPIALPAGVYAITGLGALRDRTGNVYDGTTPNGNIRNNCDAAGALGDNGDDCVGHDKEIDFQVLGDVTIPGAPPVASIMCTNCNNTDRTFTVRFGAVTDAVQYFGLFSTEGDNVFVEAAETVRLANPPEFLNFDLSMVDLPAAGALDFPLVPGTETNAQVPNDFFDDGIQYQVGVQAANRQGVRGPQATVLLGDTTAPDFDRINMADGNRNGRGNDINDALEGTGFTVPGAANMTTAYTLLENIFSTSSTADMTVRESLLITEGMDSSIGFNFFDEVVEATMEMGTFPGGLGIYSAMDAAAVLPLSGSVTVRFNEHIDGTATLMDPVLSSPSLAGLFEASGAPLSMSAVNPNDDDGMVSIAFVTDGDMINDEDLLEITFDDVLAPDTGDSLNFSASGITDEAGNALAAGTTLLVANDVPAFILTAVGTAGTANNDVLTVTFSRPIVPLAEPIVDAMGNLATNLGLTDGLLVGGMASLSMDGLTLTITTDNDGDLSALASDTVISGAGLQTNDALNFIGGTGLLPVNTFMDGVAAILVVDEVPPTLTDVIDLPGDTINTEAQMDGDMLLQVGDAAMSDVYLLGFVFDQAVWRDDMGMISLPFGDPDVTAMSMANLVFQINEDESFVAGTMTLVFDVTLNPFAQDMGAVDMSDIITISGVRDLSGNATLDSMATINGVGMGITIAGETIP